MNYTGIVTDLLEGTDVTINGSNPWDPQVYTHDFYKDVVLRGSLGLGEGYTRGDRTSEQLDVTFTKLLAANLDNKVRESSLLLKGVRTAQDLMAKYLNPQSGTGAREVIDIHYDLSADFFQLFLDPYNQYTCGYFDGTENLDVAQEQKLHLIAQKLGLKEGMTLLDLGSGWAGLAKFMAEQYGCRVTGVSLSDAQNAYARDATKGLPVTIEKANYFDLQRHFKPEMFDRVTAIGSLEHAGPRNYSKVMNGVHHVLKPEGLFLWHTISGHKDSRRTDPWIDRYIFPNGVIPSSKQIVAAVQKKFRVVSMETFGTDYDKTLMCWNEALMNQWEDAVKLEPRFAQDSEYWKKIWEYYFLSCAGTFRSGSNDLTQTVVSKGHVDGGYNSLVDVSHTARG